MKPSTESRESSGPSPRRKFFKGVLWLSLLHFVVLKILQGLIFTAHFVPPKAMNLSSAEEALVHIEDVLVFPRWLVMKLWPWESTPGGLWLFLMIFNSVVWGFILAAFRAFWRKAIK